MCNRCDETVKLLEMTSADGWVETTLTTGGGRKPRLVRRDGSKHEIQDGKLVMVVAPEISE